MSRNPHHLWWGGCQVEVMAKKYGGGGHKNAAGFTLPLDSIGDLLNGRL